MSSSASKTMLVFVRRVASATRQKRSWMGCSSLIESGICGPDLSGFAPALVVLRFFISGQTRPNEYYSSTFFLLLFWRRGKTPAAMKKPVSIKLSLEMVARVENLARGSQLKKNTVIEICIEKHLPVMEARYADELRALIPAVPSGPTPRRKTSYPTPAASRAALNERTK